MEMPNEKTNRKKISMKNQFESSLTIRKYGVEKNEAIKGNENSGVPANTQVLKMPLSILQ